MSDDLARPIERLDAAVRLGNLSAGITRLKRDADDVLHARSVGATRLVERPTA